jgi:hypothetical protein
MISSLRKEVEQVSRQALMFEVYQKLLILSFDMGEDLGKLLEELYTIDKALLTEDKLEDKKVEKK